MSWAVKKTLVPDFLANFPEWHTLSRHVQFQYIRKALDNRHKQLLTQYAELNNVLDLFCGAGGLSKGFEWANYKIIAANDNYAAACLTYKKNNQKTVLVEGDITKQEIKDKLFDVITGGKIDIIVGGPPCQGFSYAGKRVTDDPRNFLYKEFIEIVKKIKPKVVLMENVEGILTSNNGETYKSIQENFEKLGYKLYGKKIYAAEYGIPQKRKRVVIIGVKKGDPKKLFPKPVITDKNKYTSVEDAIKGLPTIKVNGGQNIIKIRITPCNPYQKFLAGETSINSLVKNFQQLH